MKRQLCQDKMRVKKSIKYMPLVHISYHIQADAKNWIRIFRKQTSTFGKDKESILAFIPKDLQERLSDKNELQQMKLVESFLKKRKYSEELFVHSAKALAMVWKQYENTYTQQLVKVTNKSLKIKRFAAEITSASLCPYDEQHHWFMISAYHSIGAQITNIAHEIFHLHFLDWYKNICIEQGLNPQEIDDLNESLTCLLNEIEFSSVIVCPDKGYPKHQNLRTFIHDEWNKKRNFDALITKTIQKIKKDR